MILEVRDVLVKTRVQQQLVMVDAAATTGVIAAALGLLVYGERWSCTRSM